MITKKSGAGCTEWPPIVDIHAHLGKHELRWMNECDPLSFVKRAKQAGITLSVVSHTGAVFNGSFRTQEKCNQQLLGYAERYPEILVWWVVDPQNVRSITSGRKMAGHPRVVGFKVHPREHRYSFSKYSDNIFGLAKEVDRPVISHCGNSGCMPGELVRCANRCPDVRLIIAHFGNCGGYRGHMEAMKRCSSANVFVDTSSSVSIQRGLIEMGVKALGVERFVFGSDHPCYHPAAQCARIMNAELPLWQRRKILSGNAMKHILRAGQCRKGNK